MISPSALVDQITPSYSGFEKYEAVMSIKANRARATPGTFAYAKRAKGFKFIGGYLLNLFLLN
jgi:hypothetical protein